MILSPLLILREITFPVLSEEGVGEHDLFPSFWALPPVSVVINHLNK